MKDVFDLYLVCCCRSPGRDSALMQEHEGLEIMLSHKVGGQGDNVLCGLKGVEQIPVERAPAILVSFSYYERWKARQSEYRYRNWSLDSGAFSAYSSGVSTDLKEYIETAKKLRDTDPDLKEIFALDVIGDHRASLVNCQAMWKAGVEAIPTYHFGEPESVLKHLSQNYPKIALGGIARHKGAGKLRWAEQCFARVWPCRIHGFGFGSVSQIMSLPWDSVDATNWETAPCAFGRWESFGNLTYRGSGQNLRIEVEHFLRLEQRARDRFRKTYKELK